MPIRRTISYLLLTVIPGFLIFFSTLDSCRKFPEGFLHITTDTIVVHTDRTYTLSGTVENIGEDDITEHGFCWSVSRNPTTTDEHSSLGSKDDKGSFSSTISDLELSATYYAIAYATTSEGTEYGKVKSFVTPSPDVPAITTSPISNVKADSATSGGTITDNGGSEVTARGVCWGTAVNPTIENSHTNDGPGTGSFTSVLSGLSCNTKYYVRAHATNSAGTGYGDTVSFTTSDCPEAVPTVSTSDITVITLSSALSGGNVTAEGSSSVNQRGICWSESPNPTISDPHTDNGARSGSFTSLITGLTPNTTYYIKAYATNSTGTSYGEEKSFKTSEISGETVTDYDGNMYRTVQIGDQLWMMENLMVTHYTDGTPIPLVEDDFAWSSLTTSDRAHCWNENSDSLAIIYGGLYTWNTAMNGANSSNTNPSGVQGVCPDGWHLPSDEEWMELANYSGSFPTSGGKFKEAGTVHWLSPNTGATNESGFTAIPGGQRDWEGKFFGIGYNANFWTATIAQDTKRMSISLQKDYANWYKAPPENIAGYSVRCIEDGESTTIPAVTTSSISNITDSTAESGGEITSDGGASIIDRGVCWSTSENPTIEDEITNEGSGTGTFTSLITGLNCNTTYYIKAYATNSFGTGYGDQVEFTTSQCAAGTVTDYDRNVYQTVQIGTQVWMAENLKTAHYADGRSLTDGTGVGAITGDRTTPYFFVHDDNLSRLETYGLLYTWAAVADGTEGSDALPSGIQGVCPDGWHVPSDAEWQLLETTLGMSASEAAQLNWRGTDEGTQLKQGGSSGFEGLLGGYRDQNGNSYDLGSDGYFWSVTDDGTNATIRNLGATHSDVRRTGYDKSHACSVRCVAD